MELHGLVAQRTRLLRSVEDRMGAVVAHGHFILGPEVQELERELSRRVGDTHCVTCANGTDAIFLALKAAGIGRGDAVVLPSFTFMATASAVALTGATPIFADVDERTFHMTATSLLAAVTAFELGKESSPCTEPSRVGAVVTVDLFGVPADLTEINKFCQERSLVLVEDGAQSFGARRDGQAAPGRAGLGTTSFFPTKPLGCFGDGGAVFAPSEAVAASLRSLCAHGRKHADVTFVRMGINSRLDTLQAAILLAKLQVFDEELADRRRIAERYLSLLAPLEKYGLILPQLPLNVLSSWAQFTVRVPQRDFVQAQLSSAQIPTRVHYPIPLHLEPAFLTAAAEPPKLPVSERLCHEVLSLPMHAYLLREDQLTIASVLAHALKGKC